MNERLVNVEIPAALAEKLKKESEKQGYKSLSDYITHILRKESPSGKDDSSLSSDEEEKIKERLKDLGYIE